jgi:hypothetical protein
MRALANSLKRIWTAKNRVPHQTRWGTPGFQGSTTSGTTAAGRVMKKFLEVVNVARRTAPTIVVVTLNIFR